MPDETDLNQDQTDTQEHVPQDPYYRVLKNDDSPHIAAELLKDLKGPHGTPVVWTRGGFYLYRPDGVFKHIKHADLNRHISRYSLSGSIVGPGKKQLKLGNRAIDAAITNASHTIAQEGFFDRDIKVGGIGFNNGCLRVDVAHGTAELVPHSPDNRLLHRFDFDYVPGRKPTKLLAAFERWFHTKSQESQTLHIACVQQYCGVSIAGIAPAYGKVLILRGDGGEGKSRVPLILEGILPAGSCSAVAPQNFAHEYHRALMRDKLLNLVGDVPEKDLVDSGPFKAIVTGDLIEARNPGERVFTFRPRCGQIWNCNTLFRTSDVTKAMRRRPIILDFDPPPEGAVDNPWLSEEIISQEAQETVCWMIDGLRVALAQHSITTPPESAQAVDEWLGESCSVGMFLRDETRPLTPVEQDDPKHQMWSKSKSLYAEYQRWAQDAGLKAVSLITFGRRAKKLSKPIHTRTGNLYPVITHSRSQLLSMESTPIPELEPDDDVLSVSDPETDAEIQRILAKTRDN